MEPNGNDSRHQVEWRQERVDPDAAFEHTARRLMPMAILTRRISFRRPSKALMKQIAPKPAATPASTNGKSPSKSSVSYKSPDDVRAALKIAPSHATKAEGI